MRRRQPRITPTDTPIPYTTLFRSFAGQTLLDIGGTQDISDTAHQVVDNCLFESGSLAFNLAGTNQPGPLIYTNNQHFNQSMAGSRFYHAWQAIVEIGRAHV